MNRSVLHDAGAQVAAPRLAVVDRAAGVHRLAPLLALLLAAAALPARAAPAFAFASSPLFLATSINPNVLVMFDNSQSMDATMSGKMIQGSDPLTRTSIARDVLRNVLTTYRYNFNWGLGSFDVRSSAEPRRATFAYYLGDASSMIYTNTCSSIVDGVGVSDKIGTYTKVVSGVATEVTGNLPCIKNPQDPRFPTNGFSYITYARSSDDGDVNDVFYRPFTAPETEDYGVASIGSNYKLYRERDTTTGWAHENFIICLNGSRPGLLGCAEFPFLTTDAGFVPDALKYPRIAMNRRASGFLADITGLGKINEPVVSSATTTALEVAAESSHHDKLLALLATEDMSLTSANIKNAAIYTPLAGALQTSRGYLSDVSTSPVTASCQRNYVLLATDGNPTGKKDGTAYDLAARTNTKDSTTGLWTFGLAVNDVLDEVRLLKALPLSGAYGTNPNGVPTYVIGMGNAVTNPSSVAALNEMAKQGGTDKAYLASSSDALKTAFLTIVTDIRKGDAAASSVVLNSSSYRVDSTLYQPKFDGSTWTGDLSAFAIDASGALATTPAWQASAKITAQDWSTGRVVLTYKPSATAGVAFRWPADPTAPTVGEIDAAQARLLDTNADGIVDGLGSERLAYLRGNTSREARNCTTCTPAGFRNRTTVVDGTVGNVLGDIVGSAPFYVGPPDAGYDNSLESVSYSAFMSDHATRKPYLYVGANDGMLHAIDAATGQEKFAYVPNLVFSKLSRQTATPYLHQYTVDGSPVVRDVFYGGAWHSLLVSGLRAGGRGLFALDVTDPSGVTETTAASVVRWEVANADLGHVFAQPALVKTNNGRWSVIVGNGYNAGTPHAQLFVIDAETGAVTQLDTGVGSAASPNGLSGVAPVDVDGDGKVDVVYAGDLDGNLWKFDLTAGSAGSWTVAFGGAPLFAAGPNKPITARPDVGLHPKGGFIVTFATGRYLAPGDVATIAPQTAYGIWDKAGSAATVTAAQLQQQIIETATATTSSGEEFRFSTHRVGVARDTLLADDLPTTPLATFYADKRGWYFDLPTSGERVVADPVIRGGRAIFTSIIPTVSADCKPGGISWVMEVDMITGNRLGSATFNTNTDKVVNDEDFLKASDSASGKTNTTGWRIDGLATLPRFLPKVDSTDQGEIKYVNTSLGKVVQKLEGSGTSGERRVMWRVVQ